MRAISFLFSPSGLTKAYTKLPKFQVALGHRRPAGARRAGGKKLVAKNFRRPDAGARHTTAAGLACEAGGTRTKLILGVYSNPTA